MSSKLTCRMLLVVIAVGAATICHAEHFTYSFDALGRLTVSQSAGGRSITYGYDAAGNRTSWQRSGHASGVDNRSGDPVVDLNGDGTVDREDLAMLAGAYGSAAGVDCFLPEADYDGSGRVDLADMLLWYRTYPHGAWLEGDWTGPLPDPGASWSQVPPDGRVDFGDLAVFAAGWGPVTAARPWAGWLDLVGNESNPRDGQVDGLDLGVFRSNWLARDPDMGTAPAATGCGAELSAGTVVPFGAQLAVRLSSSEDSADAEPVLDVLLTGANRDVTSFQFLLAGDTGTLTAGTLLQSWLGDERTRARTACFLDTRPADGGYLVTGAFLDARAVEIPDATVLCSFRLPRLDREARFSIRQVQVGASTGEVQRLADWSGVISLQPVPAVAMLLPNRPNPFNPLTELTFAVPASGHVRLGIYDVRGHLVTVLVDELVQRGWHHSRWDGRAIDGSSVASGTYLYRLEVGGSTLTGRMSLIR